MTAAAWYFAVAVVSWIFGVVDVTTLTVAVLGGGMVTAVANALLVKSNKKDIITKAAEQAVQAADTMIDNFRQENERLEKRVAELATTNADCVRRIAELESQVAALTARG